MIAIVERLIRARVRKLACIAFVLAPALPSANADAVTDWSQRSGEIVVAAGLITQPASRVLAISHTAAMQAAETVAQRFSPTRHDTSRGTAADDDRQAAMQVAIAAAHRTALLRLLPAQRAAIDNAYHAALSQIADGAAKESGIAAGDGAATRLLAERNDDGAASAEAYRPHTSAGRYVPTTVPAVPQWPQRKPWLMTRAEQFRPGPPPALTSERWARDFNEIKAFGARDSGARSAEQTAIARFWETTAPPIYHGLVRSVAQQPGRDLLRNARLFAALTQAIDDALIAVFDAKYHHAFWRPITAIRNADIDGNDATERDASWLPLIATPMHPEYPCAHCIQAGVVGALLQAEVGRGPSPALSTSSSTANGAVRHWASIDAVVQEVGDARIYDGVHYRFSTEIGTDMGRRIGALAVAKFLGD